MQMLKQSTAATILVGPVLDSAGAAVTTAVIGDFQATKNGTSAALASPATATHSHNGFYLLALTTGNTDTVGRLVISVNNTAQSMSTHRYTVLLASVYDALITNATNTTGGLPAATNTITALAGAISTFAGGAVTSVTNRVTANVDQWGGVSVTGMPLPTANYTAPPSAATNATAVRTELATELGRIDAAVSSRSTLTAAGVRTELAVELGRIDAAISSRLATTSYTAPLSASDTRTALGLASANLDTQLADLPTVAEFEARTLAAAGYASSTHWTATRAGYLDGVLIAANYNQRTVHVTGSNHVAADIHELQPAVITSAAFATGWLTAAGTAADYITELQTAIGTATNQTAILDRVSFALSALAGNCSTAQTATETYVLSIGGNTYTAAYSGLDGSGNRGTTTLTKA